MISVSQVSCFKPHSRWSFSAAIVFDRNPSMKNGNPNWIEKSKQLGMVFVNKMDGVSDEATIVSSKNEVEVNVPMTIDTLALLSGINSLTPNGRYDIWETVYEGISQIANTANNFSRALLVFTNGIDSIHTQNIDDVVTYAVSNKVRVYTVGVGDQKNNLDLYHLANDTGGKYFNDPSYESINRIFDEIAYIDGDGFEECEVSYNTSHCADGKNINIEITAKDLTDCTGNDTKSMMFNLPLDSINVYPIQIVNKITDGTKAIVVPMNISKPFNRDFTPTSFNILFDSSCIQFVGIENSGTLLNNIPVSWQWTTNGISITTKQAMYIDSSGTLLKLIFRTNQPRVEKECALSLSDWTYNPECFVASLQSGKITIVKEVIVEDVMEIKSFMLSQNYPNPFHERTSISYRLVARSYVRLEVFDLLGRKITTLVDEEQEAGMHEVEMKVDVKNGGIYFYKLTTPEFVEVKKMVMIR